MIVCTRILIACGETYEIDVAYAVSRGFGLAS